MYRIIVNKLAENQPSIAAIGSFDGLHLGHMQLIHKMNQEAQLNNYKRIVIIFEPLPREYFFDLEAKPRIPRLSLLRDKFMILKEQKYIDELIIIRFNKNIANSSAEEFICKVLKPKLNLAQVVIGEDFKFGKNGAGNFQDFQRFNIKPTIFTPYLVDNLRVSSSMIRSYAKENNLAEVKRHLGHNLHYTSRVIYGNQLGRKYGVPTINLCLGHNIPALWGIYIAYVYIEGVRYNAVASIGKNPTVNDQAKYKLEAHLLNIDMNLYGKIATVELLAFMREEKKFDNLEIMFDQIYADLEQGRAYFNN